MVNRGQQVRTGKPHNVNLTLSLAKVPYLLDSSSVLELKESVEEPIVVEYWGYTTRDKHLIRFTDAFPDAACPSVDKFFSDEQNIIRNIIINDIPVGELDSEVDNLYDFYDEYLCFSDEGMKWLLPTLCKYILKRKKNHEVMVSSILFYIEHAFNDVGYDLSYLSKAQREALYNFLEYCSEIYGLSVSHHQKLIKSM